MGKLALRLVKRYLSGTPLHPQWLIFRDNYQSISRHKKYLKGKVLDIGCGQADVKKYLESDTEYIGLDYYYTSVNWYDSFPDIYGNAMQLPLADNSVDTVLLLDVLEHLPSSEECISEIYRSLKPGGTFLLQVPFIYPIHDAPLDFKRWTKYGLQKILQQYNFEIVEERVQGQPAETSILLLNLALGKLLLNSFRNKNPLLIFIPAYPLIVLIMNLLAVVTTVIAPKDNFMPFGYRIIAIKK
jgi:SAM-dependent methyltransferase